MTGRRRASSAPSSWRSSSRSCLLVLAPALGIDDDARQLRLVRRRARRVRKGNRTDVPGVIMFEIDGLSEPVLRRALSEGHAPTMARWLEEGSHRVVPWECDLSSQTGASQAGLLLGSNDDMPAFRWYEKESGRTMVSNHGKDAVELEQRHSDGGGLLAAGGASRGNMFSGDAPHCSATMSVLRDRERASTREYFAYFADPYGFTRTVALSLWDVLLELRAARRQRKRGEEHVERGGLYPLIRASITVVMRDLNVATLLGDIVEGVPVVYSTFVGYDEVAHHSGIEEPDAFAVLRQHDAQLARLERAIEQAPRPYHLVVLSDHGQAQGRPFRQRYGVELEELVRGALTGGEVYAPRAPDEGLSSLGGALTDARDEEGPGAKMLARATRDRVVDGDVVLGPNRHAVQDLARGRLGPRRRGPRVRRPRADLPPRAKGSAHDRRDRIAAPASRQHARRASRDRVRHGARGRRRRRRARRRRHPASAPTTGSRAWTRCATSGRTRPTTCAARTAFPTARTSSSTAPTTLRPTRSRRSRSSWAHTAGSAAGRCGRSPWCQPSGVGPRVRSWA